MNTPVKGPGGRSSRPGSCCESLSSVTWLLPRPLVSRLPQALSPSHLPRALGGPSARMVGPGVMDLGGHAPEPLWASQLLHSTRCSHRHMHSHVHIRRHMPRTHHANTHVCTHVYNSNKCTDTLTHTHSQIHSLLHICAH